MYKLEFPKISHKSEYLAMIAEWWEYEKIPTDPDCLFMGENYEDFLKLCASKKFYGPESVPSDLYFLIEWERILGAIDIRHSINHPNLRDYGGHIGYGVRPSERKKWYATKMLELWLIEARKLWLKKVMLGCFDENIGSIKTIEKNGWFVDRYTEHVWQKTRIYWIKL